MWPTMNRFMIELNSSVSSLWGEYKYNLIMRYGNKKYGIIAIASFAPAWKYLNSYYGYEIILASGGEA